jgi:hypothetical protein
MTRRTFVIGVILAALSVPNLAAAAPPEGSLHLTSVAFTDAQQTGPRSFTFTDRLFQRGRLAGTVTFACRFRGRFENPHCRGTVSLPKGNLFLFLRLLPGDRGQFKVTGGTGKYQGKTGVGIFHNVSNTATRVVIWLT